MEKKYEEFEKIIFEKIITSFSTDKEAEEFLEKTSDWLLQNLPKKLFRYRKGEYTLDDKGNPKNYDIESILSGEIWGSVPSEFNDKFEGIPYYDIDSIHSKIQDIQQYFNPLISQIQNNKLLDNFKNFIEDSTLENMKNNVKKLSVDPNFLEEILQVFNSQILPLLNNIKDKNININSEMADYRNIACFSTNYKSTLMWGHYANNHKGFVLEYDFSIFLKKCTDKNCKNKKGCPNLGLETLIAPVIYNQNRINGNCYLEEQFYNYLKELRITKDEKITLDTIFFTKCLLRKNIIWNYENEWRLISCVNIDFKKQKYRKIFDLFPKAVYLGAEIDDHKKNIIKKICEDKKINCYQMGLDYQNDKDEMIIKETLLEYL